MEKRMDVPDWSTERMHLRDEEEIQSFNLDCILNTQPISDISTFLPSFDTSKENVELSLEVEIADSLKQLIASPESHDSSLLDVTIVRPTDLNCVPGLENSNTLSFKSGEVRNLIASIERQKQQKKKLIEEYKRKAASSKMNPINKLHVTRSHTSNTQLTAKCNDYEKHRSNRSEKNRNLRPDIAVASAPPRSSMHPDYKLDTFRNVKSATVAPIAVLKPLVGEIKESLKSLEAIIEQVGDQNSEKKENKKKKCKKLYFSTSESTLSCDFLQGPKHLAESYNGEHTHQVYAAPNTHDKLKTLLSCQNPDRKDEDNDKPCLCQHCGMVGLLVESQKHPIVPVAIGPSMKPDTFWPKSENISAKGESDGRKDHTKSKNIIDKPKNINDLKGNFNEDTWLWYMTDLSNKIEALELRIAAQEQRAVPKDYFKRIINKLLHKNNAEDSALVMRSNNIERNIRLKDHSTQYSIESLDSIFRHKKESKSVKQRNVQIQQNARKSYCVNPVLIVPDPLLSNKLENDRNSTVSVKKCNDDKKCDVVPKQKSNAMNTFWKWGEEIIKPGFDLKTKIMSLLDEQFRSTKRTNEYEQKQSATSKVSERKSDAQTDLPKSKKSRNKPSSANNVIEKKETLRNTERNKDEEKPNVSESSSKVLKKMLDMMSEKIYNEHVKPTVEAIKNEQKCFNTENTKQINNIKTVMDAALSKINPKDIQLSKSTCKKVSKLPCDNMQWQNNFLEPLEIPPAFRQRANEHNSKLQKLSKKSGIPVRVSNMLPTDYTLSDPFKATEKLKSFIPRLMSAQKDCPDYMKPCKDNNFENETKPVKDLQKPRKKEKRMFTKEQDVHLNAGSSKSKKNLKSIQVKYMNPKAEHWNEESGASVLENTSEETNQAMLTDNSSRSQCDNNKEEVRRISQKYSVADKLAFLINVTKEEMGKAHIWNNILKEAKNHCKSKQDKVIIQIPTKHYPSHYGFRSNGLTEVEFTIEDIQKLVDSSKLKSSSDLTSKESVGNNSTDSFLLIHSKKILREVHKRLEKQMLKN